MTLREFLSSLATDADQLAAFQANPDKVMQAAGLSTEEQELVQSGNQAQIIQYLQGREPGDVDPPPMVVVQSSLPPSQE